MVNREDLRSLTVCSVDPPGCTDIDDALHCRELDNGNLEVHILDTNIIKLKTWFFFSSYEPKVFYFFAVGGCPHR